MHPGQQLNERTFSLKYMFSGHECLSRIDMQVIPFGHSWTNPETCWRTTKPTTAQYIIDTDYSWSSPISRLRSELTFITFLLQLPNFANRESMVQRFLDISLSKLQLDYVDLYLIHTPFGLNYRDDNTMIPMTPDNKADIDYSTDLEAIWKVRIIIWVCLISFNRFFA